MTRGQTGARRSGAAWVMGAVFLVAVAVQLPIFDRSILLLDEGYMLQMADEINRGKVLYRDVYVDAPFPGAFYILAGWFRLMGPSVYASRLLILAVFALFVACVARIGCELLPRPWVGGLAVVLLCYRIWAFPHWHVINYSPFAATALTGTVALVFAYLRSGSRSVLAAAGVLAGLGIVCKQDYGLALTGAVGLFLLVRQVGTRQGLRSEGRRLSVTRALGPTVLLVMSAVCIMFPVFAYFTIQGALGAMVKQTVLRPLHAALSFTGYPGLPSLSPLFHQDLALRAQIFSYFPSILFTLLWREVATSRLYVETAVWDVVLKVTYYAPFGVWAMAALAWGRPAFRRVWRGTLAREDEGHLLLLAYAGAFLLAFNPPRDWVHLMMIYPPVLVVGVVLVEGGVRSVRWSVRFGVAGAVGILVALLVLASVWLGVELRRQCTWPLRMARGGVFVNSVHGPIIDDVIDYVRRHASPGEPVPVYPIQPMLGFLDGRESAAGFHVIWPISDPERDDKIIADLERRDVGTVIYSLSQFGHLGSFASNAPRLYEYLVRRYEIAAVFSRELWGPIVCALRRRQAIERPGIYLLDLVSGRGGTPAVGRDAALSRKLWPFAEVLALRVGTPGKPVTARMSVSVPGPAPRFVSSYGINPDRWLDVRGGPFTFTIRVEDPSRPGGQGGGGGQLFRATLDPRRRLEDRRWVKVEVDLAAYAGRRVTLLFSVQGASQPHNPSDVAGWAHPRIVAE